MLLFNAIIYILTQLERNSHENALVVKPDSGGLTLCNFD